MGVVNGIKPCSKRANFVHSAAIVFVNRPFPLLIHSLLLYRHLFLVCNMAWDSHARFKPLPPPPHSGKHQCARECGSSVSTDSKSKLSSNVLLPASIHTHTHHRQASSFFSCNPRIYPNQASQVYIHHIPRFLNHLSPKPPQPDAMAHTGPGHAAARLPASPCSPPPPNHPYGSHIPQATQLAKGPTPRRDHL